MKNPKQIFVVSGPSGSGKTTLVSYLLKKFPEFGFSISATTRKKRDGEVNEKDYYFLSVDEFRAMIKNNKLIEYQEVYNDLLYGTPVSEIERIHSEGKVPLLDIDVFGALNVKKLFGDSAVLVLIHPGSIDELRKRLEKRGTETPETLKTRLEKAGMELNQSDHFDHIIFNNSELEIAMNDLSELVKKHLSK